MPKRFFRSLLQPVLKPLLAHLRVQLIRPLKQKLDALEEYGALLQRFNLLEEIITEHPACHAHGYTEGVFPSPAVTVIMPVWNRAALVKDAIRSVQAQDFTDWELLVVDDGSTDGTKESVAGFLDDKRIRYVKQAHAGQCRARNLALKEAKGALIAYLDSDNLWYPEFLFAAVTAMAADPQRRSLYGAMITGSHAPGRRILFRPFDRAKLLENNFIGMSTFVHRRELADRFGGFDETLASLEDWDLILRFTQESPAFALPVRAVRYRAVDARVTDRARAEDMRRVYGKWGKV